MTALKNEPGGNIALSGSVSVVRQLLAAGLLDELESTGDATYEDAKVHLAQPGE